VISDAIFPANHLLATLIVLHKSFRITTSISGHRHLYIAQKAKSSKTQNK